MCVCLLLLACSVAQVNREFVKLNASTASLHLTGNAAEEAGHYQQATTPLNELKKESGPETLLDRSDLKAMIQNAVQGTQQAKNYLRKLPVLFGTSR
jgi:hypothetical protein